MCSCSEVCTNVAHVPRQRVWMVVCITIRQGDSDGLVRFCLSATLEWSIHNTMQISTLITNVRKCNPETKNIEDGAGFGRRSSSGLRRPCSDSQRLPTHKKDCVEIAN